MSKAKQKKELYRFVVFLICVLLTVASFKSINQICKFKENEEEIISNLECLIKRSIYEDIEKEADFGYSLISKKIEGEDFPRYKLIASYKEDSNEIRLTMEYPITIDKGILRLSTDPPKTYITKTIGTTYKIVAIIVIVIIYEYLVRKFEQ
ncbi:MAG: hypothetical protein IJH39_10140 [Clostridia bacterium]|nr:hypothetical protein [Clostridia bacterium]